MRWILILTTALFYRTHLSNSLTASKMDHSPILFQQSSRFRDAPFHYLQDTWIEILLDQLGQESGTSGTQFGRFYDSRIPSCQTPRHGH